MKELCVVHLVRAHNGIEPFRRFLESYRANPSGIEHDLLIVFKGFAQPQGTAMYRELLAPFRYETLDVSDEGFDITAYFTVTKRYSKQYRYFCFLNSYCVILDAGWLSKMYQHISQKGVGMVGATGSYQSLVVGHDQWKLWVEVSIPKSKYPRLRRFWIGRLDWTLLYWLKRWVFKFNFSQFPNYHIRSNAFMVREEIIKKVTCQKMANKIDAYKCESGRRSITNQVMKLGKTVLVIGKDGKAYKKEDWWKSNTFWRENQENLLISDNQTRAYADSELAQKIVFSYNAWGENASPKISN